MVPHANDEINYEGRCRSPQGLITVCLPSFLVQKLAEDMVMGATMTKVG